MRLRAGLAIFSPKVLTFHPMTRNLIIGGWHVCITTVLDQSRLISVALSVDFLVRKWVKAIAMRMIAMCRNSWRCKPSGCPLVNCREKEHIVLPFCFLKSLHWDLRQRNFYFISLHCAFRISCVFIIKI